MGTGRIGDGFWERRRVRISCDAKVSDHAFGEVLRPSLGPRISATGNTNEAPLGLRRTRLWRGFAWKMVKGPFLELLSGNPADNSP